MVLDPFGCVFPRKQQSLRAWKWTNQMVPLCSPARFWDSLLVLPLELFPAAAVPLGGFQLRPDHCQWLLDCAGHPGFHEIVKRANALMECLALEIDMAHASRPPRTPPALL